MEIRLGDGIMRDTDTELPCVTLRELPRVLQRLVEQGKRLVVEEGTPSKWRRQQQFYRQIIEGLVGVLIWFSICGFRAPLEMQDLHSKTPR